MESCCMGSYCMEPYCLASYRMVSITSAWAMPGTLIPSLKLVLLSKAPVGMKSTFFQLPYSSCFRI